MPDVPAGGWVIALAALVAGALGGGWYGWHRADRDFRAGQAPTLSAVRAKWRGLRQILAAVGVSHDQRVSAGLAELDSALSGFPPEPNRGGRSDTIEIGDRHA